MQWASEQDLVLPPFPSCGQGNLLRFIAKKKQVPQKVGMTRFYVKAGHHLS